jgi:hypothetical protein
VFNLHIVVPLVPSEVTPSSCFTDPSPPGPDCCDDHSDDDDDDDSDCDNYSYGGCYKGQCAPSSFPWTPL